MLILAVDTSGPRGGITLARAGDDRFEIVESAVIEGGTFSAELIPQISQLLTKHNLKPQQLEGLVAVTGPGSFTGLRVGLTAVKGLAEVLTLPIATVTSLEVLAAASGIAGVMAVLDAGRGEAYVGMESAGEWRELLLSFSKAHELSKDGKLRVVTADANIMQSFEDVQLVRYSSSEFAARLGFKRLLAEQTVDVLALDANYVRRSEVEYMQKLKK
jgi:tRNA threonylcarbamoyladenosine biosynthesis protein TsaB